LTLLFSINKKGRNYQKGIPLSSDLWRIILFQELGKDYASPRRSKAPSGIPPRSLGNSRKVPYTTTDSFLEFLGSGFFELEFGGQGRLRTGILKAWFGAMHKGKQKLFIFSIFPQNFWSQLI